MIGFKKLSESTTATSMADTDLIPAMTSGGIFKKISLANFKSLIKAAVTPDAVTATAAQACDSIMIVTTKPDDSTIRYDKVEAWASHKNQGYTAIGILVNDGDCRVIVALDECSSAGLLWSSSNKDIPGLDAYTSGQKPMVMAESVYGAANTQKILAASADDCITSTTDYAAGFCNSYSKMIPWSKTDSGGNTTSGTVGIPAGKWYLPSMRELWAIYTHLNAVQYALGLVGGTKFSLANYWSSTEYSAIGVWVLSFSTGTLYSYYKSTSRLRVRPCAAFL